MVFQFLGRGFSPEAPAAATTLEQGGRRESKKAQKNSISSVIKRKQKLMNQRAYWCERNPVTTGKKRSKGDANARKTVFWGRNRFLGIIDPFGSLSRQDQAFQRCPSALRIYCKQQNEEGVEGYQRGRKRGLRGISAGFPAFFGQPDRSFCASIAHHERARAQRIERNENRAKRRSKRSPAVGPQNRQFSYLGRRAAVLPAEHQLKDLLELLLLLLVVVAAIPAHHPRHHRARGPADRLQRRRRVHAQPERAAQAREVLDARPQSRHAPPRGRVPRVDEQHAVEVEE